MTTAYTPILKLALPQTGELSGTWGTTVNDNITSMVEQAVAGLATINTWTTNAHTLTTADGTTSESRCAMLVAADGAGGTALTGAGEIICPAASKLYVLKNGSSYAITLKTSGGTGVAVPAGDTAFLFCDGTNVNSCVTTVVDGHISGNLTVDGNTTLGNANTDTVTVNAQFNTDLLPSTDNARDLGSTAKSWRTLYCDTSVLTPLVTATNLQITNIKANDGTAAMSIADSTGAVTVSTILNVDNLRLDGNTLSSTDSNGNVVIAPNGTGDVQLDADTVRVGDSNANATITTNGTGDLILNTNSGTNSGAITIEDGVNGNIIIAPNGTGQVQITNAALDLTTIEVTNIKAKDGTAAITIADSTGAVTVSTLLNVDNLRLDGNTISSTDSNGNITLAPNGTGDVYVDADTVRIGDSNANATLTTNGTGDLILNTNAGTNSGSITIEDAANGNILIATNGTGQVQVTGDLDVTTIEVTNIKAKDGTASIVLTDSTGAVGISTAVTMSATTQNIALGTSQTSGTFTVGGAAQTGTQTFDQSTKTHTLNIGAGATENTLTKTINIGTGGVSGSTTAINIGSTNGTTVTVNGTVNATTVNVTTLDLTNLEVTNIKAKDGTASMSIADSTGVVTFSANPVLNAGTANGVPYLNASKVLTSGSALTFDGSQFAVNASSSGIPLVVNGTGNTGLRVVGGTGSGLGAYFSLQSQGANSALIGTEAAIAGNTSNNLWLYGYGSNSIVMAPATAEMARFTSTGLHLGTSFSSISNRLQVAGNVAIGYTTAAPTTGLIVAGNVGIGTDSPAAKLDIVGNTNATFFSARQTSANGSGVYIQPYNAANGGVIYSNWVTGNGSLGLAAGTATAQVVLTNGGNLGIGTTSPAYRLHVAGTNIYSYVESAANTSFAFQRVTAGTTTPIGVELSADHGATLALVGTFTNHPLVLRTNNTERARIDTSGQLLIGVTTGTNVLTVVGASQMYHKYTGGTGAFQWGQYDTSGNVSLNNQANANMLFATDNTERARITSGGVFQVSSGGSVQVGGTAARATTAGTNRLDIFNGTAPVGTLTNGISIYSSSGEAYVMDAAGNATLFSPHDAETNEWIFKSKHTPTGKVLKIDVEKLLRFINDHFGLDAVHEFIEE